MVNLLGLGTILVLPIERVRLLRLQKQGATTVLPSCACNLAHFGADLYSKCSCPRTIKNFGTGSYQIPWSKLVLDGDCVVQKREVLWWLSCGLEDLAFLTVDLAFHVQWDICQV